MLTPFEQKLFIDKRELFARDCPDCAKNMVREAYEAGFELAIKMFCEMEVKNNEMELQQSSK